MNKRIKKKRWLETRILGLTAFVELLQSAVKAQRGELVTLRTVNNLQQETIEDYGRQLGDLKRRVAELEKVGGCNALACNNRFDQLEAENKASQDEIAELKRQMKSKKSWFGRK